MKLRLSFSSSLDSTKEISFQRHLNQADYYSVPRDEEIFLDWYDPDHDLDRVFRRYTGFITLSLSRQCDATCKLGNLATGERGNFFTVRAEEGHKVETGCNYEGPFVRISSECLRPIPLTFRMLGWMHQHCVGKVILHAFFSVNSANFCQDIMCRPYKITPSFEDY
jgi:hypothetical protein